MASSSRPIVSTDSAESTTGSGSGVSAADRANGLGRRSVGRGRVKVMGAVPCGVSSEFDLDVADGGGRADLDAAAGLGVDLAGAQVARRSGGADGGAGVADAHPAAVLWGQAGGLGA